MNLEDKRLYLIEYLKNENRIYDDLEIPEDEEEKKALLRAMLNVRIATEASDDFLKIQDEYLTETIEEKGITDALSLKEMLPQIYLWQGDITTLKVDVIVNAANSGMTGCYMPNHACIDNCIHTFSGVQLRLDCAKIMEKQGHEEPTGKAKITSAYNLPSKYIIHTVGPIIKGEPSLEEERLLASSYLSSLELAASSGVESIAFPCISTGVFHFPNERAAEIAIETVMRFLKENESHMKVYFNVFTNEDYEIYRQKLEVLK